MLYLVQNDDILKLSNFCLKNFSRLIEEHQIVEEKWWQKHWLKTPVANLSVIYLARVTSIEFMFFLFILTQESIKMAWSKCVVKENIVLQEVEELSFSIVLIILK